MTELLRGVLALMVVVAVTACRKGSEQSAPHTASPPETAWLENATERYGLRFHHEVGPSDRFFMPETVGSGAAFLDYDNDGRLDIYLIQNAGPNSQARNKLFHQEPDGHFKDVSPGSGLDVAGYGMGVAVGDVNNDGLPDVLVTEYGRVRFFVNRGGGKFEDTTSAAAIEDTHWATSAAFFDYDRDGWLDLVIVNYIDYLESEKCYDRAGKPEYCGPNSRPGTVTQLFHNLTGASSSNESPKFEEVTVKAGLAELPGPGLGVLCADFDGDNWPDILAANDARPNTLWINRHDGTFRNEAAQRGIAYNEMGTAQANMGIAMGDVTGDGLFDVYITHLSEENNVMWFQGPRGLFQDRTATANLANTAWHGTGFGVAFVDLDNDGDLDLALVNGRVRRSNERGMSAPMGTNLEGHWSAYGERNQIFANDGTGRFRDLSAADSAFCSEPNVGRGLACGDIDNDGGMDLLVTAVAEPARLFHNIAPKRGHWLLLRAVDPKLGGRNVYGVRISLAAGGKQHVNWINPGYSYECSNDPRAHFGLGQVTKIDSLQVLWPDGVAEEFSAPGIDQLVVLRRGSGRVVR